MLRTSFISVKIPACRTTNSKLAIGAVTQLQLLSKSGRTMHSQHARVAV